VSNHGTKPSQTQSLKQTFGTQGLSFMVDIDHWARISIKPRLCIQSESWFH